MPEPAHAAFAMVDIFAAAGADRFDVTLTSLQGKKVRFCPNLATGDVRHKIPQSLKLAEEHQHNIILRSQTCFIDEA